MNHRSNALIALSAIALLTAGSLSFATDENKSDAEVAAEYKGEAAQLREQAKSHRKLAQHYKHRKPHKGVGTYGNVAKHCENLANLYEQAAKEAEAVASILNNG